MVYVYVFPSERYIFIQIPGRLTGTFNNPNALQGVINILADQARKATTDQEFLELMQARHVVQMWRPSSTIGPFYNSWHKWITSAAVSLVGSCTNSTQEATSRLAQISRRTPEQL